MEKQILTMNHRNPEYPHATMNIMEMSNPKIKLKKLYESLYIQYGDASVLGVTLKQNYNYHLRVQPMPTTKCV